MLRIAMGLAVALGTLVLAQVPQDAAARQGPGRAFVPSARMHAVTGPRHGFGHRFVQQRHAAGFHRRPVRWYLGGAPFYPSAFDGGTVILRDDSRAEAERPVDRSSFEHMPVSTGIEPAPLARPVIYRIEGPRARPRVRVLRIGIDDRRAGHRHVASTEGGNAEILTIRPR